MDKFNLLIIVFILNVLLLFSQNSPPVESPGPMDLPVIIPPSPTVSELMKFEEIPVDEYSGVPNISIPLFTSQLASKLNFDLSLKYHPSGVRIKQHSSWVGTGWSLDVGGVISRTVMGKPDEKAITGIFNNGFFEWDSFNAYELEEYKWEALNRSFTGKLDTQLDLYQFNFFGHSGRFIVIKDGTGDLNPVILSLDQKLKIDLERHIAPNGQTTYSIDRFTITDQNGYVFEFAEKEFTQSMLINSSTNYSNTPSSNGISIDQVEDAWQTYNSAWHLTQVKLSNGVILMDIDYQSVNEIVEIPGSRYSTSRNSGYTSNTYYGVDTDVINYNLSIIEPRYSSSTSHNTITTKKPTSITLPKGEVRIDLLNNSISGESHPEFSGGCILNQISILQNNNAVEEYSFVYSEPNYLLQGKRLFLDNIVHSIGANSLSYNLGYHNKTQLPGFHSNDKDKFGYYSRVGHTDGLRIKNGTLNSIEYPTGGIKEFVFESNTYSFDGSNVINPLDIPENYYQKHYTNQTFSYDVNNPNTFDDLLIIYVNTNASSANIEINSVINHPADSDFLEYYFLRITPAYLTQSNQNNFDPNCFNTGNLCYFPQDRNDFIPVDYNNDSKYYLENDTHNFTLSQGFYFVEFMAHESFISMGDGIVHVNIDLDYRNYDPKQNFTNGGGLRIEEINFIDNGATERSVKYDYSYVPGGIAPYPEMSSGSLDYHINSEKPYAITRYYPFVTHFYNNGSTSRTIKQVQFSAKRGFESIPAQMTKGNYVGYKHIKKYETGNGRMESTYTSPIDYPAYGQTYGYPFLPVQETDYKHGLILSQKIFDEQGRILKSVENIDNDTGIPFYDFTEIPVFTNRFFNNYQSSNCGWDMLYKSYSGYLSKLIEDPNVTVDSTLDNCDDNPVNVDVQERNYYANKAQLRESRTTEYFYDTNGNVSETSTREFFSYASNNLIATHTLEISEPPPPNGGNPSPLIGNNYQTIYNYTGSGVSSGLTPEELAAKDKLQQIHNINELINLKKYYNGEIIDQLRNTFQEPENDLVVLNSVQSGKEINNTFENRISYHEYDEYGNPLELSKANGTSIMYIWGYHDSVPIAKIVGSSYTAIPNDLETLISQARTMSNSESNETEEQALRDQLELIRNHAYLSNSQVTTLTYDPLIGVTSITDPRGNTIYYEYDAFNRLEFIRDFEGNILSENDYNYRLQTQN